VTASDRRPAVRVEDASGTRTIALESLIDPDAADRSEADANAWIKSLRLVRIGECTLRDRFTHRGDSLWWFAELYLHKTRAMATALATIRALESLGTAARRLELVRGNIDIADAVTAFCRSRNIPFRSTPPRSTADIEWQARGYMSAAAVRHLRRTGRPPRRRVRVAAFVHSAFWRDDTSDDAYVGPVLDALAKRVERGEMCLVGLGPRTNFRARSWRARLRELRDPHGVIPVEMFASWRAMHAAREVWRNRVEIRRALGESTELRDRAILRGCDLTSLLERQLDGIAQLQFPWSALAMDEAAAALDALEPSVAFTYAEAGGWGRALALECRRRGVPLVALQHGFIYRHWLNYQHEPDEVVASPSNPCDKGFPAPKLTLLHDELARRHLLDAGRFDPASLRIVGSTRLDRLAASARSLDDGSRARLRARVSARDGDAIVLVAAKSTQIAGALEAVIDAVRHLDGVRLVIKCHPADTKEPYERAAAGATNVTVVGADFDLGSLIVVSRLLITVNSTAAIEAMALGVPSLVVALPNNLTPLVNAGVMAGATDAASIAGAVKALLYHQDDRVALAHRSAEFLTRNHIVSDGRAADRAADAVLECAR
jgi:hypothetical protein